MPREKHWSNRLERLHLIENLFLKEHQNLRTGEIAEKFAVSHDTVTRDLNFLSSTGRLPLVKEGFYWKLAKETAYISSSDKDISVEAVKHFDYDVALSYASEDRGYADAIATILQREGVKVFYDKYEKATLWGQDLYSYLSDIYQNKARYCVMFLSRHYAAKLWTSHERQAAQARAFKEQRAYILPIRLDDTVIPGILPTTAYLTCHQESAESVANTILQKLENVICKSKQDYLDESDDLKKKGYHERALIVSEQAVRIDPYDPYVHEHKGYILLGLERYEEALASFNRAIYLCHNDDDALYEFYCSKGQALRSIERYEEALETYEQALKLAPGGRALCEKGETLCDWERYEEALTVFETVIQIQAKGDYPSRFTVSEAQAGMGRVLCNQQRYDEALVMCEKAIRNDPWSVYGYNVKGETLSDLERYDEALTAFERATEVNPKHPYAYQYKAYILYLIKRYPEALAVCEQVISLDPEDAHIYNTKGNILKALERHNEAMQAYEMAKKLGYNE